MGFGLLADRNRWPAATLTSNADWSPNSPLVSCQSLPLLTAAVSSRIGTAANPVVIQAVFPERYACTYAGWFRTNFRQAARYRLELFASATFTGPLYDTRNPTTGRDRAVVPSLLDWRQLRWGDSNLFRGDLPTEDFALYPTNIHVVVPYCRVGSCRWTFYGGAAAPDGTDAASYSLGYGWISDSLQFWRSLDAEDGYVSTDEVTRFPGGGVSVEPGTGYRTVTVPRQVNGRQMRDSLFDLARRVDYSKPVVWLPNIDDPAACFRYGGLFQRRGDHANRWFASSYTSSSTSLEEITT
ncbi:hypothetical protein D3093_34885 (plasmid) [Azospirillum argentinense]|uniref:Uncharacterized protein n=1 Tax=Azospirillum argentinense TaxID=2970906 RepID=A0A4D8Q0M1_9PROT|nr:hypothetical protein [Azospirillum argentinense]QCO00440.1 hypothetical protein D3093_34885 [Azospirillum argentinense]